MRRHARDHDRLTRRLATIDTVLSALLARAGAYRAGGEEPPPALQHAIAEYRDALHAARDALITT